ncbi:hypothetical protein B0H11DRAFT_1898263 [Mycena galericulata]|nr:hypothetical protein B0H11DRAFT_1898263 [Mycena galericulata]
MQSATNAIDVAFMTNPDTNKIKKRRGNCQCGEAGGGGSGRPVKTTSFLESRGWPCSSLVRQAEEREDSMREKETLRVGDGGHGGAHRHLGISAKAGVVQTARGGNQSGESVRQRRPEPQRGSLTAQECDPVSGGRACGAEMRSWMRRGRGRGGGRQGRGCRTANADVAGDALGVSAVVFGARWRRGGWKEGVERARERRRRGTAA